MNTISKLTGKFNGNRISGISRLKTSLHLVETAEF